MSIDAAKSQLETLKLQADEHEVIKDSNFQTAHEYILHLMHRSDYETAASLAHGKTALDLGCNGGHGTRILGEVCESVTGVDVSPAAIAAAKAKHESEKVSFRLVDGLSLPFPDHSFDLVTSFQVIEHLAEYETYLSEIRRVLRPEGLLLITTPNAAIRVQAGQKPWNPFHVREFRGAELAELLQTQFQFTRVLGQFASPDTYAVEYNRCIQTRGGIADRSLAEKVAGRLRRLVSGGLEVIRNGWSRSPRSFQDMHSVEDFFYKSSDVDLALSLVACCTSHEPTAHLAATAFLHDR